MTQAIFTTPRLIPDNERMDFLPKHFGQRLMLRGELAVYGWLDRLSEDYQGGYWHYYELPGSFYLAPAGYDKLHIVWPLNWCDRTMSADAAGIVATLYALCELCQHPLGAGGRQRGQRHDEKAQDSFFGGGLFRGAFA
jgi:hypothetical protein